MNISVSPPEHPSNTDVGFPDQWQLTFSPVGGRLDHDVFISFFTDQSTTDEPKDFDGGHCAYKGHKGVDFEIQSLAHMDVGVPVFAALPGVVIEATAEQYDRNTSAPAGGLANFVTINHGHGLVSRYGHLAKHSLCVAPGETVFAGTQLALVGSAGTSDGPHLHWEVRLHDQPIETFAGKINDPILRWEQQPPLRTEFQLSDAGLVAGNGGQPVFSRDMVMQRPPHITLFGQETTHVLLWVRLRNLHANDQHGWEVRNQHGTIVGSTTETMDRFSRWDWRWWSYALPQQERTGTWSFAYLRNEKVIHTFPFSFATHTKPALDRLPTTPVIRLVPHQPAPGRVIACEVLSPQTLPGTGVIKYTYTWTINHRETRTITSAAQSDYLAAHLVKPGQRIACTVTAGMGNHWTPSITSSVIVSDPTEQLPSL